MAQIAQDPQDKRKAAVKGAKRWIKRVRILLVCVSVVLCVYVVLSYSLFTLPGTFEAGSNKVQSPIEDVMPGDTVLLLKLNLWREPKLDDVVIYNHPDPKDGVPESLIGRIAGMPGETITRNGPTMQVGDRGPLPVGFPIGAEVPISDKLVIPDGEYLVVTDTDAVAYADSRDFGLVKREALQTKVVLNLAHILGQRPADNRE